MLGSRSGDSGLLGRTIWFIETSTKGADDERRHDALI
jgi:hypothetical protein